MYKGFLAALTAALLVSQPSFAKDDSRPDLYRKLMDCRAMSNPDERLACYDEQTAALDEATQKREIVISDKKAIDTARRGLFGFAAPIGKLMGFGGNDDEDDSDEIKEIETSVSSVRRSGSGWLLKLEDGSTWEQNDTRDFVLSPKVGNTVRIKRGVLGTYLVSVQGQRSIKMRRIN
ncbi:hypothetical protein [Novosphingobium mangrovi (ex Huang et al. 2023)]|uniref:Secreted protein n=1 Tax=Novosphingobium mangrovi (ex Huang et al. 2023) TaxID=2976432 RepID=A0ABT2I4D3_9SPHN|nr:hypothetical protein [Novosphingobium mangrovi (ex Huang et al. 2023)]MCT2399675.1 hypothetical protein [Novosphingobium mangrovi (ex Huang et al. 2023)]